MIRFNHWQRISWALVLTALFAGPAWARADGTAPDCYVLSVGVDAYAHASKLSGCVTDARDAAARFRAQQGKRFGKVTARILVDRQASRAAVGQGLAWLNQVGRPGDFAVVFLSGHGGQAQGNGWFFLPQDYDPRQHAATVLSDRDLLAGADALAERGLKVLVIVDACYSGRLRLSGGTALNRHRSPGGGGIVLMLSSGPEQTSFALGQYSAYARAVAEGLGGEADSNGDGHITLDEVGRYARARTHQLLRQKRIAGRQDGECHWSPSISGELRLAATVPAAVAVARVADTVWSGNEDLANYGQLTFHILPDNRAIMVDARSTMEGTWQQQGSQVTLTFDGGRIVYRGTVRGTTLSGTAGNGRTTWTWSVRLQGNAQPALRVAAARAA